MEDRILLSGPDVGEAELAAIQAAFESGWIAPVGPDLDGFERELADYAEAEAAVGLSSGTAALHVALLLAGVGEGDEVVVQSATFAASAFAVVHAGARPVFCDIDSQTWGMDVEALTAFLEHRAASDSLPRAIMPVDLFGSCADYARLSAVADRFGVVLIRDAAEALGSVDGSGHVGATGGLTAVSFNGNKIMTTSSGGALLGSPEQVDRARFLATQAREPELYYEHREIGYNYRLSNLLAALGRAQLSRLEQRIARRAEIAERYRLSLPGLAWCPFGATIRPNHWLSVGLLSTADPLDVCRQLNADRIEARPAWKPMHRQPVFADAEFIEGTGFADRLFESGICLPSGSGLSDDQIDRVIESLRCTVDEVA